MTPELQRLALWGGGALVVLIAAALWLSGQGEALDQRRLEADQLHAKYVTLYPAQGMPAPEAAQKLTLLRDHQLHALEDVEKRLVPDLPAEYLVGDLGAATARLNEDYAGLRKKAQREKVVLVEQLPLRDGLDADHDKRSLQLAQLHLVRSVLELCMRAGIPEVAGVDLEKPYQDPTASYAVVPASFRLRGGFEAVHKLLEELRGAHERGFGLAALEISHDDSGIQSVRVVADLITYNQGAWKLGAAAETAPVRQPRGRAAPRSRPGG